MHDNIAVVPSRVPGMLEGDHPTTKIVREAAADGKSLRVHGRAEEEVLTGTAIRRIASGDPQAASLLATARGGEIDAFLPLIDRLEELDDPQARNARACYFAKSSGIRKAWVEVAYDETFLLGKRPTREK